MASKISSQKDLEAALNKGATPQKLPVPSFFVGTIQVAVPGNIFNLVFSVPHPITVAGTQAVANDPVVTLNMSPQTAKDLALLMQGQVAKYEEKYGVIKTEYTERKPDPVKAPAKRPARKLNG